MSNCQIVQAVFTNSKKNHSIPRSNCQQSATHGIKATAKHVVANVKNIASQTSSSFSASIQSVGKSPGGVVLAKLVAAVPLSQS